MAQAGAFFDTTLSQQVTAAQAQIGALSTQLDTAGLAEASATLAALQDGTAIATLGTHVDSRMTSLLDDMSTYSSVANVSTQLGSTAPVSQAFGSLMTARSMIAQVAQIEQDVASYIAATEAEARAAIQATIEAAATEVSSAVQGIEAQIASETQFFQGAAAVLTGYAAASKIINMFENIDLKAVLGAAASSALIAALNGVC